MGERARHDDERVPLRPVHSSVINEGLKANDAEARLREYGPNVDVLCVDKTGTITQNRLELAALEPDASFDEVALLRLAAEASDAATQDPIDSRGGAAGR